MSDRNPNASNEGENPVSTAEGPGAAPEGGTQPGAQHTGDEGGGLAATPGDTSAPPSGQQGAGADRNADGTTGQQSNGE